MRSTNGFESMKHDVNRATNKALELYEMFNHQGDWHLICAKIRSLHNNFENLNDVTFPDFINANVNEKIKLYAGNPNYNVRQLKSLENITNTKHSDSINQRCNRLEYLDNNFHIQDPNNTSILLIVTNKEG